MQYIKRLVLLIALLVGFGSAALALPQSAIAADVPYNPLQKACNQPGAKDSAACTSQNSTKIDGNDGILVRITRIVAVIAGVVAVIMIIIYGLQLIYSYGDASKATTARNGILAATAGLVIIGLAQAIVVYFIRSF